MLFHRAFSYAVPAFRIHAKRGNKHAMREARRIRDGKAYRAFSYAHVCCRLRLILKPETYGSL